MNKKLIMLHLVDHPWGELYLLVSITTCSKCHEIGPVLGQMATGSGEAHLEEQLNYISVPSLTSAYFVEMERTLGTYLKLLVMEQILSAGQEE